MLIFRPKSSIPGRYHNNRSVLVNHTVWQNHREDAQVIWWTSHQAPMLWSNYRYTRKNPPTFRTRKQKLSLRWDAPMNRATTKPLRSDAPANRHTKLFSAKNCQRPRGEMPQQTQPTTKHRRYPWLTTKFFQLELKCHQA